MGETHEMPAVMLSEAKHLRISLKRNPETLRCAQGDEPPGVTLFSVTRLQSLSLAKGFSLAS